MIRILPSDSFNNTADCRSVYSKKPCDLGKIFYLLSGLPQLVYHLGIKDCVSVRFSVWMSIFRHRIHDIIFLGSNKKMVWIGAIPDIAFVKDEIGWPYWPNVDFERKPMDWSWLPEYSRRSISILVRRSLPNPTRFRFVNTIKESPHRVSVFVARLSWIVFNIKAAVK